MKTQTAIRRPAWWIPALIVVVASFGCNPQDDRPQGTPVAPEQAASTSRGGPAFDPTEAMTTAIQDEYHAQAVYAKVLTDLGDITPFANIVLAEGNHVAAIAALFTDRGWAVPASEWDDTNVPTFDSRLAACEAGRDAEIANVALYDVLLLLDLPNDVTTVFTNLRAASQDNHLPAFETCVAKS
jgi:hypothetical protein